MTEVSIDAVGDDLEAAFYERDERLRERPFIGTPVRFSSSLWCEPSSQHEANRILDYFNEDAARAAEGQRDDPNEDIAMFARSWLAVRERVMREICHNVNCLRRKVGRQRLFCGKRCQEATATRRKRDLENPKRKTKPHNFDRPTWVKQGHSGNRRWKKKSHPTRGIDSIVTSTLSEQLHRDVVSGTTSSSERIAKFVDSAWTPAHEAALKKRGSLRNQREEKSEDVPDRLHRFFYEDGARSWETAAQREARIARDERGAG
jgi:hypothetical protein